MNAQIYFLLLAVADLEDLLKYGCILGGTKESASVDFSYGDIVCASTDTYTHLETWSAAAARNDSKSNTALQCS